MRTPKTGLAKRMRGWMGKQKRTFTRRQLWEGIGAAPGKERAKSNSALIDFIRRGEVEIVVPVKQNRRQKTEYRYNQSWKRASKRNLGRKIDRAIYVSNTGFMVSDIQRLSEAPERSYVTKRIRKLNDKGYLKKIGRRPGKGVEYIYTIVSRERFRIEIL